MTGIIVPLLAGLAVFLFGMKIMEAALRMWAGPHLKKLILRLTSTPLKGMLAGTGLTALVQSSSAVTVISVGLVNAGLMSFPQSLGIILGTNIGTSVTTELISLDLQDWAPHMLLGAAAIWLLCHSVPRGLLRRSGYAAAVQACGYAALAVGGFASVLMGMAIMQTIVPALEQQGLFAWFVEASGRSLLWGMLAGALLTALIQSSAAAIAMTMGFVASQAISLELGIAIAFGSNVGTCATAFLASIGGSRLGQYVAWSHIVLNIGGALLFYPFIPLFAQTCVWLTADPASQLAHAQTMFNLFSSIVALPLCYLKRLQQIQ